MSTHRPVLTEHPLLALWPGPPFPVPGRPGGTPTLYLAASGTHWCRHDSLFMCNFWLRLESRTTAPFSKQPLLLYKKQAIPGLDVGLKYLLLAPLVRGIKGLVYSQVETMKLRLPWGRLVMQRSLRVHRSVYRDALSVGSPRFWTRGPPAGDGNIAEGAGPRSPVQPQRPPSCSVPLLRPPGRRRAFTESLLCFSQACFMRPGVLASGRPGGSAGFRTKIWTTEVLIRSGMRAGLQPSPREAGAAPYPQPASSGSARQPCRG